MSVPRFAQSYIDHDKDDGTQLRENAVLHQFVGLFRPLGTTASKLADAKRKDDENEEASAANDVEKRVGIHVHVLRVCTADSAFWPKAQHANGRA
jgi:hypothetical protein